MREAEVGVIDVVATVIGGAGVIVPPVGLVRTGGEDWSLISVK